MQKAPIIEQPEAIRSELERVIASPDFDASDRNRRFLAYVVEETLAGRADRIKAYAIATSVFGRDDNFDSQLDSIVRIEAGRLRRSLEMYYLTAGSHNPLRIVVPRGTYVPSFVANGAGDDAPHPLARAGEGPVCGALPRIFVLDFIDESSTPSPFLASGLTRQTVVGLTRFSQLKVFGPQSAQALGAPQDPGRIRADLGIDFFVGGSVAHVEGRLFVDALLFEGQSGRYLWAESYDRPCDPSELLRIRDEVASNVVRTIAQPWGVIFSNLAAEADTKTPADLTSLDAVVQFHQYAAALDVALYPRARAALEHAVESDLDFGEAWACLSRLQTDAMRFGYRVEGDPPPAAMINRAIESARRAVGLSPNSSQSFLALGQAYWFKGDVDGGLAALSTALMLNPNDTEAMVELGLRQCLRLQWDEGVQHIEAAYASNPALPPNHRIGLSLWHLAHGRMHEALDEAVRMNDITIPHRSMLIAVSASAIGRTDLARAAIDEVMKRDPTFFARVADDLAFRNLHPDLIEQIVEGLHAAGVPRLTQPAVAME